MRAAVQKYDMIQSGDVIAVGVSAGKDSLALLCALARLKSFYPQKFELKAITIDMRFNDKDGDFSEIRNLCDKLGIEYTVVPTNLYRLIFEARQESNPCSLCSKMRRGALNKAAAAAGCNKVALGHHLDDVAETFIMNLFNGGSLDCFMPVTYLDRSEITVIRPMIFARESDCARVARNENLPVRKSACPADGNTEREEVKEFLSSLEKKYGNVRIKILEAMQKKEINGY
jgi:tRNA(Ile)-lysidine synthase TilS/MesJ